MMHHPNMHHQAMPGHPPQHLAAHQAHHSPHHNMPPPLHRDNRHVTITRVPLGPGGGGMHQGMGGLTMPVHHAPRAPHPIRAMHHPQQQHHVHHPQMKPLRRSYMGGGYMQPYHGPLQAAHNPPHSVPTQATHSITTTNMRGPLSPIRSSLSNTTLHCSDYSGMCLPPTPEEPMKELSATQEVHSQEEKAVASDTVLSNHDPDRVEEEGSLAAGDLEASHPSAAQANSKEKTPMCLVNELARYNKIKHQYRLTSEQGPAHKKIFTVTLRLSDVEEYTAEGSSIKRAQHAAANAALTATAFPAPPPRAAHSHSPLNHHHRHSVMPTVELNALAMKLCQPAVYTSVPPVPLAMSTLGVGVPGVQGVPRPRACPRNWIGFPRIAAPTLVYRVRVAVGGRAWLGEGGTPQAARHDAAARALQDLRSQRPHADPPPDPDADEMGSDPLNSEVKSPVSLVHELALKRSLSVIFTVKSERGPPHMRVFITICTVGELETEGEGNGKKVSKRRAAEKMLEEMRTRWPPGIMRARPAVDKRRPQPIKKKPRNLIKEGGVSCAMAAGGSDNPISRLAVARHAARARSPQYRVLEERGTARRREFIVQCLAPPHAAIGLGPNKKSAKRRAAHNVLLAMEMDSDAPEPVPVLPASKETSANAAEKTTNDTKRKDSESLSAASGNGDGRQPVPGVLLMDHQYHQRTGQSLQTNGVSETSNSSSTPSTNGAAAGGAGAANAGAVGTGGTSPGAKDQLMYLAHLLGFTVQFSDFPKRNHGEYLSLVSLSTEPPVMCHGGGPSTAHSHEQCSRAALRALALMGLDTMQNAPAVTGTKPITNGISE